MDVELPFTTFYFESDVSIPSTFFVSHTNTTLPPNISNIIHVLYFKAIPTRPIGPSNGATDSQDSNGSE